MGKPMIMKKSIIFLTALSLTVCMFAGCKAAEANGKTESEKHRVIIDTDTGSDDAAALLIAAKSENLDILGVTVLYGNVPLKQSADNAIMTLETGGCSAPVYIGTEKPLFKEREEMISVHGQDGMGDQDLIHPNVKPQEKPAVDYILDTVKENPGEIEIICLGPLTNIAMAVQKDPDTMKKVKRLWIMGTTGFGPGNATPVAEFNVYNDAEAYDTVLRSGVPATIVGLDCQNETSGLSDEDLSKMAKGNEMGRYESKALTKLTQIYRKLGRNTGLPDALAMAAIAWPGYVKEAKKCYGVTCINDDAAYGQVIFYVEGNVYESMPETGEYNLEVVSVTDDELFKKKFLKLMTE